MLILTQNRHLHKPTPFLFTQCYSKSPLSIDIFGGLPSFFTVNVTAVTYGQRIYVLHPYRLLQLPAWLLYWTFPLRSIGIQAFETFPVVVVEPGRTSSVARKATFGPCVESFAILLHSVYVLHFSLFTFMSFGRFSE